MLRSSSQTVQLQGDASNQMSVWQPIDTAPDKEGSRALLFDGKDQFVGVLTRYNRHCQWRLWTGDRPAPRLSSSPRTIELTSSTVLARATCDNCKLDDLALLPLRS